MAPESSSTTCTAKRIGERSLAAAVGSLSRLRGRVGEGASAAPQTQTSKLTTSPNRRRDAPRHPPPPPPPPPPRKRERGLGSKMAVARALERQRAPVGGNESRLQRARHHDADLGDRDARLPRLGAKTAQAARRAGSRDLEIVAAGEDGLDRRRVARDHLPCRRRQRQALARHPRAAPPPPADLCKR